MEKKIKDLSRIKKNTLPLNFFFVFTIPNKTVGYFNSPEITLQLNWKPNWIITGNLLVHLAALSGMNRIAFENVLLF